MGYRFEQELRDKLLSIDFSKIDGAFVKEHRDIFTKDNRYFAEHLEELPKKGM